MASPNRELAEKLAKRRSIGEEVFEREAAPSLADEGARGAATGMPLASRSDVSGEPRRASMIFESEGAASVADAAYGSQALAPAGDSAAFEAALEKIRAFERVCGARGRGAKVAPGTSSAMGAGAGACVSDPTRAVEIPKDAATKAHGHSDSSRTDSDAPLASSGADSGADSGEARAAQREDFKSIVQERFIALIRGGMPPNEAAARAILEAAGQQAADSPGDNDVVPARSAPPASAPLSPCSEGTWSCASSAKEHAGKRGKKKSIVVVA